MMTKNLVAIIAAGLLAVFGLTSCSQAQAKSETPGQVQASRIFVENLESRARVETPVKTVRVFEVASRNFERVSSTWVKAQVWARRPLSRRITWCESRHTPTAVNPSGKYRGLWQMDHRFWITYGGRKFASRPDRASAAEQNVVAYTGWLHRGYKPWRGGCSGVR